MLSLILEKGNMQRVKNLLDLTLTALETMDLLWVFCTLKP